MDGGGWWAAVHGVAKLDTTEQLHFHFSLSGIGEGNGNPLQYSCLEIPMGGGAWYATPHGVTKSQTRLTDFNSIFRYSRRWVLEEPAFIYIVECSAYVFFE